MDRQSGPPSSSPPSVPHQPSSLHTREPWLTSSGCQVTAAQWPPLNPNMPLADSRMKDGTRHQVDLESEPLFVDLDGTLLLTDMLEECLACRLATGRIFTEFYKYPLWLLRGIPEFKRRMAAGLQFDLSTLPVNQPLLEYLKEQRVNDRELHLISASEHVLVTSLGEQFGIFASCEGTRASRNLKGQAKVELIHAKGIDRFSYAANSRDDIPVWNESVACVLVNTPPAIQASMTDKKIERVFPPRRPGGGPRYRPCVRTNGSRTCWSPFRS